jgi:hypothetical protein
VDRQDLLARSNQGPSLTRRHPRESGVSAGTVSRRSPGGVGQAPPIDWLNAAKLVETSSAEVTVPDLDEVSPLPHVATVPRLRDHHLAIYELHVTSSPVSRPARCRIAVGITTRPSPSTLSAYRHAVALNVIYLLHRHGSPPLFENGQTVGPSDFITVSL